MEERENWEESEGRRTPTLAHTMLKGTNIHREGFCLVTVTLYIPSPHPSSICRVSDPIL